MSVHVLRRRRQPIDRARIAWRRLNALIDTMPIVDGASVVNTIREDLSGWPWRVVEEQDPDPKKVGDA